MVHDSQGAALRRRLADRSVGRCSEALHAMGIAVPRQQAVRMAQDFEAFYETRERSANDTADDATPLVLSADAIRRTQGKAPRCATPLTGDLARVLVAALHTEGRPPPGAREPPG
ncbi:MAG: hypothetical protein Q7V43_24870 [Myxococcales bacterium]|jgi:hypothetical protein|nr:hypothetical protein [Myxococcales bacterium]